MVKQPEPPDDDRQNLFAWADGSQYTRVTHHFSDRERLSIYSDGQGNKLRFGESAQDKARERTLQKELDRTSKPTWPWEKNGRHTITGRSQTDTVWEHVPSDALSHFDAPPRPSSRLEKGRSR